MTLEAAIADLEDRGLSFQSIPEENSTVAEDIIHRTDPVAGTIVVDNQVITLYFNPRKELQEVPNVEGQPLEDAQRILSAAGFQIGQTTYEESDNIAENSVIRTDPPAGEQVEQATTINLIVSSGRDQQAVPQIVIGRPEADARQLLENPPYSFVVVHGDRGDQRRRRRARHPHQPGGRHARRHRRAGHAGRVERRPDGRGAQRRRRDRGRGARPDWRTSTSSWCSRTCRRATATTAGCSPRAWPPGSGRRPGRTIQLTVGRAAAPRRRRPPRRRPPRRRPPRPPRRRRRPSPGPSPDAGWG